jgi:dGTPase
MTFTAPPRHPVASRPEESRGRLVREPESATRNPFQRDRDRIVHSTAFRRLKHKTQVFVAHEGDHYRTRLTHTIEVAQIARSISRALGFDEDLAEALALAHDLGHPPFGHAGEDALDEAMKSHGGFDHNEQTFRILTLLERHYAEFDGLNLTWECLEGVVKHNGPLTGPAASGKARQRPVPATIAAYCAEQRDLELDSFAGPEAQVAAIADDIAYDNHDMDDGLRAGLFGLEDVAALPLVGPVLKNLMEKYSSLETTRLIHETVRRSIDLMVTDLIEETRRRLEAGHPQSAADVRAMGQALVAFSPAMIEDERVVRRFLFERMYRHHRVNQMTSRARDVVRSLFGLYMAQPQLLPPAWQGLCTAGDARGTARVIGDYIAGMTDRFALDEQQRLASGSDAS